MLKDSKVILLTTDISCIFIKSVKKDFFVGKSIYNILEGATPGRVTKGKLPCFIMRVQNISTALYKYDLTKGINGLKEGYVAERATDPITSPNRLMPSTMVSSVL